MAARILLEDPKSGTGLKYGMRYGDEIYYFLRWLVWERSAVLLWKKKCGLFLR